MEEDIISKDDNTSEESVEQDNYILVNSETSKNKNPADSRNFLSTILKIKPKSKTKFNKASASANELVVDGVSYYSVSKYVIFSESTVDIARNNSLIERGANVGVVGEDVRIGFTHPDHRVNVRGTDDHDISSARVGVVGGVTKTTIGEITIIIRQHVYHSKGNTICSSRQIENFKKFIDDKSIEVGGE